MLADVRPTQLELSMPRFRISAGLSLRPVLERLGIVQAFDCAHADFSGITTTAATAVIMTMLSMPTPPQLAVWSSRDWLPR